tara:strand:+ start:690 stop:1781 length:1092 start_codon:yes stop_codon:yes gene_type:complete
MTQKIKYAIIGTGAMGREHIRNIEIIENAEVVALCDTFEDSIKASYELANNKSIKCFNNIDSLIQDDSADAYVISTPNFTHIDVIKKVLVANKHLLIEKPMCTNVDDCFELQKITNNYKSTIWIAMEYRYMLPVSKMTEYIHTKKIGDLKMLTIKEHRQPFLEKVRDWNRFSRNTGGTLVEKCCHFFDLMRLIIQSEPTKIFASAGQDVNHLEESYNNEVPDIIDNAFVIVDFKNGVRSTLDLCMFAENTDLQEEFCAVGNLGKIETGVPSNRSGKNSSTLRIGMRNQNNPILENITVDKKIFDAGHHHGSTYYEHLGFINSINNKLPAEVSIKDGLYSVAMGQAAEISAKEGRVVKMSEFNL